MRFGTLDDLVRAAPTGLGVTDWETISQHDVDAFGRSTRALEWIHLDGRKAVEGPFAGPVAHGFLTLALATHFQTQLLELPPVFFGVNYGVRSARFPSPVPVGSRVRATGTLLEAEPAPSGCRILVELRYERAGAAKPPCVAEVITLVVPTDPTPEATSP